MVPDQRRPLAINQVASSGSMSFLNTILVSNPLLDCIKMSTHPRLVLSHTERDQLFRRAEETLGNRLPPDAVAVHLESTVSSLTYATPLQ